MIRIGTRIKVPLEQHIKNVTSTNRDLIYKSFFWNYLCTNSKKGWYGAERHQIIVVNNIPLEPNEEIIITKIWGNRLSISYDRNKKKYLNLVDYVEVEKASKCKMRDYYVANSNSSGDIALMSNDTQDNEQTTETEQNEFQMAYIDFDNMGF